MTKKFDVKALDQQVNWLNEFLENFLRTKSKIKQALHRHFDSCKANDYDDGIKKFNLGRWGGGTVNPTVEIVQVEGELKFATTRYGVLAPLNKLDCNRPEVKTTIMNFFINPAKYFPEESH